MALRSCILRLRRHGGGECGRGNPPFLRSRYRCFGGSMALRGSSEDKSTMVPDLCRKLADSRDREIAALKMALEARKCEARAIAMFNKRMRIDVCGMEDDVSGSSGHSRELRALRSALVAQEEENLRIMERNRELQKEIERLRSGRISAAADPGTEEQSLVEARPIFEQCFIRVCKPPGEKDCGSKERCPESGKVVVEKRSDRVEVREEQAEEGMSSGEEKTAPVLRRSIVPGNVDVVHPWPEWVLFMEHLKKMSYLRAIAEREKVDGTNSTEESIKAAAMRFCAAQDSILQRLSQEDLMVFGSFGCPSTDRRIVNSGKRLRKHLNLAEADVCKFCKHSNICSRAYCDNTPSAVPVESRDILWLLLQYGFDAVSDHSEKRPLPDYIGETIRSILQQIVFLAENPHAVVKQQGSSSNCDREVQMGNWRCTRCKLLNFSGSKICRGCSTLCGHDGIRTGEWKCFKCNLKNLPRSLICQECSAPRPPKELRWGDWECPNCQGVNFARNKECFRCKSKQPPFKEIGVNKITVLESTAPKFALGVTPWLMTEEEKNINLVK